MSSRSLAKERRRARSSSLAANEVGRGVLNTHLSLGSSHFGLQSKEKRVSFVCVQERSHKSREGTDEECLEWPDEVEESDWR